MKEVIGRNRFRNTVEGRLTFNALKAPPEIIRNCRLPNPGKRRVTFWLENGERFSFTATITSGWEILLPRKYQHRVEGQRSVDITVEDH
jgi:hypothetical protein